MLTGYRRPTKQKGRLLLLVIPLVAFVILKTIPDQNRIVWSLSWYTRIFQFYLGSFASLIAVIVAMFSGRTLKRNSPRAMFTMYAFINLSILLLISSIATPSVLLPNDRRETFIWSLRFAFFMGALAFSFANIHWETKPRIIRFISPTNLGVASLFGLIVYSIIAFIYSEPLVFLNQFSPRLPQIITYMTLALFAFSLYRTLFHKWQNETRIENKLPVIYILLAEAQLFLTFGTPGGFSWLLYHPMVLFALMLAIFAILDELESARDIHLNRYFAIIGSIVIAALSLTFGEIGSRFLADNFNRTSVVALVLAQSVVSFLVLYIIVIYLNRLIRERNVALKHEQYLRSELTQLIVHDLKSPLTIITSGINLLAKGNLGDVSETQARLLSKLEQSGKQILNMIDDLLDVERLEAGALNLQKSHVNIVIMLRETINNFQIIANTNRQNLHFTTIDAITMVEGDKRLLQRVFHNLLSNALKFTPENGRVKLSTEIVDNYLMINFEDNGPGVPEHERERIFEKFAQVERAERRGAGLGLTFCKMVIEAHDGFLIVKDSPMGGAQFCIGLPLPPDSEPVEDLTPAFSDPDLTLKTL